MSRITSATVGAAVWRSHCCSRPVSVAGNAVSVNKLLTGVKRDPALSVFAVGLRVTGKTSSAPLTNH